MEGVVGILGIVVFIASAWAAGSYLTWIPILVISLLLVMLLVFLYRKGNFQGLEGIATTMLFVLGVIWMLVAWITYYMATDQRWVQDFFNTYIFR